MHVISHLIYPLTSLPVQGLTTRTVQNSNKNLMKNLKKIEIFFCTVYTVHPTNADRKVKWLNLTLIYTSSQILIGLQYMLQEF